MKITDVQPFAMFPQTTSIKTHPTGTFLNRIRFGLCCLFIKAPIKFRTSTITYLNRLEQKGEDPFFHLSTLIEHNLHSLLEAFSYCKEHQIRAYRIISSLLPAFDHQRWGYKIEDLPNAKLLLKLCGQAKAYAAAHDLRLSFHPDQFIVLSSPDMKVVESALRNLEAHDRLATLLGADVINIHAGGTYGDKQATLKRLANVIETRLAPSLKAKLTVENDEYRYSPTDLLPLCKQLQIPLVYDVHHHRCNPDGLSIELATEKALKTWNREPLFHLSSPLNGWKGPYPQRHHDYIDPNDFPKCWKNLSPLTVDVEAKAKELAVLRLMHDLDVF